MGEISILIGKAKRKKDKINKELLGEIKGLVDQAIKACNDRKEKYAYVIQDYEISIADNGSVLITIKKLINRDTNVPIARGNYNSIQAMNIQGDIKAFIKKQSGDVINVLLSDYYVRDGRAI